MVTKQRAAQRRRQTVRVMAVTVCLGLAGAGGAAVWLGTTGDQPPQAAAVEEGELAVGDLSEARKSARFVKSLVRIPARAVAVQSVKLTVPWVPVSRPPGGSLQIPGDPSTVGWWKDSAPLAAAQGTTLLVGHVALKGKGQGAFAALENVKLGDSVLTSNEGGATQAWVVSKIEVLKKGTTPPFPITGVRRLAMVTCTGPILKRSDGTWSHRDNLVVWGVPAAG